MFPAVRFLARPRAPSAFAEDPDTFIQILRNSLEDRPPLLSLGEMIFELREEGSGKFTPCDISVSQRKKCFDFFEAEFQMLQGLNELNSRQDLVVIQTKPPATPVTRTDEIKLLIVPNGSE
jgi:hypothetical protein